MKYNYSEERDERYARPSMKKMKSPSVLDFSKKEMEKERQMKRKSKQVALQFIAKTYEDDRTANDMM